MMEEKVFQAGMQQEREKGRILLSESQEEQECHKPN